MRTLLQIVLVGLTLLFCSAVHGADDKSHRQAAEELLKSMNIEKQLQTAIDQMLDVQVKANPQLAPLRNGMKRFLMKHMSWDGLKDELITIYADAFTEEELKQIHAFYKTPVGKKVIEKTPELMSRGMQLGVKRVQANQAELQKMLEEERNKIQ